MKYVDYHAVLSSLEDSIGDIVPIQQNVEKVVRMVAKAMFLWCGATDWPLVEREEVKVCDGIGELPCMVVRLLHTQWKDGNRYWQGQVNGGYITANRKHGTLLISYYAMPFIVGEDGRQVPAVPVAAVNYCTAYCTREFFYPMFLTGKIDGQRWGYIDNRANELLADTTHMAMGISMNDMEESLWAMRNGFYFNNYKFIR